MDQLQRAGISGDMRVMVAPDHWDGKQNGFGLYIPIKDLCGIECCVWNGDCWSKVTPFRLKTPQVGYVVRLSNGRRITCVGQHSWCTWIFDTKKGNEKRLLTRDLVPGSRIRKWNTPLITCYATEDKTGYTAGFFRGDGSSDSYCNSYIYLYGVKELLVPYLNYDYIRNEAERTTLVINRQPCLAVPLDEGIDYALSWLAGYIDSDGSCSSTGLSISSGNKLILEETQLLMSRFGITTSVSMEHDAEIKAIAGRIAHCDPTWRVTCGLSQVSKLATMGTPCHRVNLRHYCHRNAGRFITVDSVIPLSMNLGDSMLEETFSVNETRAHNFMVEAVLIGDGY